MILVKYFVLACMLSFVLAQSAVLPKTRAKVHNEYLFTIQHTGDTVEPKLIRQKILDPQNTVEVFSTELIGECDFDTNLSRAVCVHSPIAAPTIVRTISLDDATVKDIETAGPEMASTNSDLNVVRITHRPGIVVANFTSRFENMVAITPSSYFGGLPTRQPSSSYVFLTGDPYKNDIVTFLYDQQQQLGLEPNAW